MRALILSLVFVVATISAFSQTPQTPNWINDPVKVIEEKKQQNDKLIILTCTCVLKTIHDKKGKVISVGELSQKEKEIKKVVSSYGYQWIDTAYNKEEDRFMDHTTGIKYELVKITLYGQKAK